MAGLNPAHRFVVWFLAGVALWLIPIGIKAPSPAIAIALPSAIACFVRSHYQARRWEVEARFDARSAALKNDIEAFTFGAEEEFNKTQILAQFFGGSTGSLQVPQVLEPEPEPEPEPLNHADRAGFSGSRNRLEPSEPRYTCHELRAGEARRLIAELLAQGLKQAAIIEQLWGVKKGGSRAYKSALAQYRSLQGEG
jgi:hypothetical protein